MKRFPFKFSSDLKTETVLKALRIAWKALDSVGSEYGHEELLEAITKIERMGNGGKYE